MNTITVRNLTLGDGTPRICVPIIAHTFTELEHTLESVRKTDFDLIEFRADFYFEEDEPALKAVRETIGDRPILYTIRTKEEGGEIEISDDEYEERSLAAARSVDLVDVQFERLHAHGTNPQLHSRLIEKLHQAGVKVIGSWHNFDMTPACEEMVELFVSMQEEGCDITKIAVMPNSRADVLSLIKASVEMAEGKADRPFISMSMGNLGKITRAAGAFTGSCITFGTADALSAPGQIAAKPLREMIRLLAL